MGGKEDSVSGREGCTVSKAAGKSGKMWKEQRPSGVAT